MKDLKICCIGAGYVGGPTMSVIAYKCPRINVTVVDSNSDRIDKWNGDVNNLPIYEPGLADIVKSTRNKNLFFSTDIDNSIIEADIIFISVNTPTKTKGIGKGKAADLKYIEACARKIGEVSKSDKIVVEKSTLPVRTAETIQEILKTNKNSFEIISNPEFLAEGTAIQNMLNPDRVLIGSQRTERGIKAAKIISGIYSNWIPSDKILLTNLWSSELSKLVSNAFLAQRISSINSISALCEKTEANIDEISLAIGSDTRIGSKFLKSSVGFGGSCFQKDILNLIYISEFYGLNDVAKYWEGVININDYQKNRFSDKIIHKLFNTVDEKVITILGWAFKKDTNDSCESASIYVAFNLLENGAILNIYDPKIKSKQIRSDIKELCEKNNLKKSRIKSFLDRINVFENRNDAFVKSHAVAILTEWDEFIDYDWSKIINVMENPASIFDGRNILNRKILEGYGYNFFQIGS